MAESKDADPYKALIDLYEKIVATKHPARVKAWPLIAGFNGQSGGYNGWSIFIFRDTGTKTIRTHTGMGEFDRALIGFDQIDRNNIAGVRQNIEQNLNVLPRDGVIITNPQGQVHVTEFEALLQKHETALRLAPMKVFLSHKGVDKPVVRDFYQTLKALGFDPWLDEDAMPAGTQLERGILNGFEQSCAAIFLSLPASQMKNG